MRRMLTMHRGVIKYLSRTGYPPSSMTAIYHRACWFHVRFGSKADICSAKAHVRFTFQ
jgi:hypothetical protein